METGIKILKNRLKNPIEGAVISAQKISNKE